MKVKEEAREKKKEEKKNETSKKTFRFFSQPRTLAVV